MPLSLKPLLLLGCSVSGACAIGYPVSTSMSEESYESKGQIQKNIDNLEKVDLDISEEDDIPEEDFLSFEELWEKMNVQYQGAQIDSINSEFHFPWKQKLKNVIEPLPENKKHWQIISQDWQDCKADLKSFCGFLELKNGSNEYKLRISLENDEWKITVAKKEGEIIKYYLENQNNWKEITDLKFNELSTFRNLKQGKWENIHEYSFLEKSNKLRGNHHL